MSPASLLEKLQSVWEVIASSPLYGIAFFIILFLVFLFITTNKTNKKQSKITYFIIYLAIFIYFFVQYGSSIQSLFDYAINQFFINYYFPNIIIYLLTLIISTIILWKSIFSDKTTKSIKIINSFVYGIIVYFFILTVSLIEQLNLNAFNLLELYSSMQVRSILELSMFVFVIWVIFLIIYKIIRNHQLKIVNEQKQVITNYDIVDHVNVKRAYDKPKQNVFFTPVEEETKKEPQIEDGKEPFTLDEYKTLLRILLEEKNKKEESSEDSLTELNALYKSIE